MRLLKIGTVGILTMLYGMVTAVDTTKTLGAISGGTEVVETYAGDLVIDRIEAGSSVNLTSTGGSITVRRGIVGGSTVILTAAGDIHIGDQIAGGSRVSLRSSAGEIFIEDEIGGASQVCVHAFGRVRVGARLSGGSVLVWSGSAIEGPAGVSGRSSVVNSGC